MCPQAPLASSKIWAKRFLPRLPDSSSELRRVFKSVCAYITTWPPSIQSLSQVALIRKILNVFAMAISPQMFAKPADVLELLFWQDCAVPTLSSSLGWCRSRKEFLSMILTFWTSFAGSTCFPMSSSFRSTPTFTSWSIRRRVCLCTPNYIIQS